MDQMGCAGWHQGPPAPAAQTPHPPLGSMPQRSTQGDRECPWDRRPCIVIRYCQPMFSQLTYRAFMCTHMYNSAHVCNSNIHACSTQHLQLQLYSVKWPSVTKSRCKSLCQRFDDFMLHAHEVMRSRTICARSHCMAEHSPYALLYKFGSKCSDLSLYCP